MRSTVASGSAWSAPFFEAGGTRLHGGRMWRGEVGGFGSARREV